MTRSKTKQEPIRQSEIQAVNDLEHKLDVRILSFRRRLQSGATVEPGKWQLTDDGSSIAQFETPAEGGARCGLNILPS